ncbi:MAG TPA: hypothetical protein VHL34_14540, partial [Rhizomicrobium sp.]|nr:hypothetical protein [Rhizomicrobium sp.]
MIKRFAAASLIALLPAQALAANWVSTSVDAFTVPQPKTYGAECAGPSNGVFANVKDTKTFTGVSIDEDINCVKFTYNGAEYFVHATQVAHPPLGAITVDACKML